jgi:hypothetical protein
MCFVISLSLKTIMISTIVLVLAMAGCIYGMGIPSFSTFTSSLPPLEDLIPSSLEGQIAVAAGSGCAVGFIAGPKGCIAGGTLGAGFVLLRAYCPVKDPHGINVCMNKMTETHYGVEDDDSFFPLCPGTCVHLMTEETFTFPFRVNTSEGTPITIKEVYAQFRVPIRNGQPLLNQPFVRDAVLNSFYKKGSSLQETALVVPLQECITFHSEKHMKSSAWNVLSGRVLGQELLPTLQTCLESQGVPHVLKSLHFTGIRSA